MSTLISSYKNGNCLVNLYQDGTKERFVKVGEKPQPIHPDNMDVKITNWCDAGCSYCHESSNTRGKHAHLQVTIDLLKQLPSGVEIAIGGGHPLSHPDFDNFVKELTDHGLVCNITINQHHFTKEQQRVENLVSDGLVKGVGYSYVDQPCEWNYEHLVSHVIIGTVNQDQLSDITKVNNKILLLGYKNFRKGLIYRDNHSNEVESNIMSWYRMLGTTIQRSQVSFDNLAIEQLNPKRLFNREEDFYKMFMGEEGQFSMYVDAVNQKVAIASFVKDRYIYQESVRSTFNQVKTFV